MMALPTLKQMQYLLALRDTMNFSRAAEQCNITQPTLSAAINELEAILGQKVLDRSRRKQVTFTTFGQEVLRTAEKIMPPLERLSEQARYMAEPLSGKIRLGLIPTVAPYLLPKILPNLHKTFDKIEFHITEDMTEGLIQRLHRGNIDLAILAFPYITENLNQMIFFEEPFYCAANPDHFGKKKKISLNDLKGEKLLLLEDGHCLREHALSACKLENIENQKILNATSLLTLVQMVAQGYGITLLPQMATASHFIPQNVDLFSFVSPPPTRQIGACWRQKDPQEANIQAVLKQLKSSLKH